MVQIYLTTIPGLDNLTLHLEDINTPTSNINDQLKSQLPFKVAKRSVIATTDGSSILKHKCLSELINNSTHHNGQSYLNLHLRISMCGGKGGFGSALKKSGGQMNSKKTDKSNYKTLSGVKLKTLKKLERLEKMKKDKNVAERKKLDTKKEKLMKILNMDPEKIATKDAKFDDSKYLEDLNQAMEDIRDSVGSALESSDDEDIDDESDEFEDEPDHDTDETDEIRQ
ncbi:unnamed protein product [Ambrosiozyma monospora]|uniref:Unnamed protein product n=1 Tax=Ambrosiozyma monospora TaxID=43982 RepID=A0ACB5T1X3_AMBMO|nr:unnamed protein product [Ambrosiozyma monospora]